MASETSHKEGHRQRLRDRFVKTGLEGFADYEVVELLLTLAIPRSDVKQPAKQLINKFGNLRGILDAPLEDLQLVKGIGTVAPIAIRLIKEAANLYLQQTAEDADSLADFEEMSRFWKLKIGALSNEVFYVAYLNSALKLLRDGIEKIEDGTIDRATIYPRSVIESALKRKAAALICAHNHPNGDVCPTEQDKVLTRALVLAGNTVDIKIYDHVIVSTNNVFSFRQEGLL